MNEQTYILVEGVNIYSTLLDTDQLSVIRGGSFLYKQAIVHIKDTLECDLDEISTGASRGLFSIKSTSENTPADIEEKIIAVLNEKPYKYLTFIVVYAKANNILKADKRLLSRLRFRQLQSISSAPDSPPAGGFDSKPCDLDGVRARSRNIKSTIGKTEKYLSDSVKTRLDAGKNERSKYYANELQANKIKNIPDGVEKLEFCQDFQELSSTESDYKITGLSGKIAVFYTDGNSFGSQQRKLIAEACTEKCDGIDKQKEIDTHLRKQRAIFLNNLLKEMLEKRTSQDALFPHSIKGDSHIRLETLLWGGDEMMFVVPAWLGMDLVQFFYAQSKDWTLDEKQQNRLTHAGGVVFCSAKTPIRNVQNLVRDLAENVKIRKEGRTKNMFDYVVLESIDYPAESTLEDFFTTRYGELGKPDKRTPLTPTEDWKSIKSSLHSLLTERQLAKRQVYRIANEITRQAHNEGATNLFMKSDYETWEDDLKQAEKSPGNGHSLIDFESALLKSSDDKEKVREGIKILFNFFDTDINNPWSRANMWLHLVELWDYLTPRIISQTRRSGEHD